MSDIESDGVAELVADVEEFLGTDGFFCLYEFSWFVRGRKLGLSEPQIAEICGRAYEVVRQRHHLKLVWLGWPTDPDLAVDAPQDSPLDFDIDSTGTPAEPMLALMPR